MTFDTNIIVIRDHSEKLQIKKEVLSQINQRNQLENKI